MIYNISHIENEHFKWLTSGGQDGNQADFSGKSLPMHNFSNLKLRAANFSAANLENCTFTNVDLSNCDFSKSNLKKATFKECILDNTNFSNTDLTDADFSEAIIVNANFTEANLTFANMTLANLDNSIFVNSNLTKTLFIKAKINHTNLSKANLYSSNLSGASLLYSNLDNAIVTQIKNYKEKTKFRGTMVATCLGNAAFRRYAQDQDFIEELKESGLKGKIYYYLWLVFADCGRSIWRWAAWSCFLALYFGIIYYLIGEDSFRISSPNPLIFDLKTTIYYSVVTFTTLGFGDITPTTFEASYWIMLEVVVGYIMLGGLISIFATILARRS